MTRHDYQDMSTGYSPLRLATPSGTGLVRQPCVNCGETVKFEPYWNQWLHPREGLQLARVCREVTS